MNLYTPVRTNNRKATLLLVLLSFGFLFPASSLLAQRVLVGMTSNGGPEGKGTVFSIKTDGTGFGIMKSFADWGALPASELVRGKDGDFYGMAPNGGAYGHGTIFRITSSGSLTLLRSLELTTDGGYPKGSLIQALDGNFYGMTNTGSVNNGGSIFKIAPDGTFTLIKSLLINTDGGKPNGHLIQAKDSSFYGINNSGGANAYGNIFRLTRSGQYTVLKNFASTDGASSYGSLMQASDGNFYGMTYYGGTANRGVIFRMTPGGQYAVLKSFASTGLEGQYPTGDLVQGRDGYLYGMTPSGGANNNGVIFRIKTDGTSFSVVRNLAPSVEGSSPKGRILVGADGLFYIQTYSFSGYVGSVFTFNPTTNAVNVIKKFTQATEGGYATGSLIQAPDGMLYGMTSSGGINGDGTIFKLSTAGAITLLAHMNGSAQGNAPQEDLAFGKDSAYYGVNRTGGAYDYGTVFKICGGVTTVLKSFNRNADGGNPDGGLVMAKDGNFYGMTESGGLYSAGTIYRISPSGAFSVVRHLKATTDGGTPKGTLALGLDSALYGMTSAGGTGNGGTIFKITTGGIFTVLRHLVSTTDGSNSEAGLVLGKDGNFYGLTGYNTRFFRITKDGVFTVLRSFTYSSDGGNPGGNLVLGSDGFFYGTLSNGGAYAGGVIIKIGTDGALTKLRHLNPTTDGSLPKGGLVLAPDGYFYGMTSAGGKNKVGTIFRISSGSAFNVVKDFTLAKDGGTPLGGFVLAPINNLVANPQYNLTTNEDVAKAITLTGSGATTLTYTIVVAPKNGTVSTGTSASRVYTPRANFNGKDSFAFTTNVGCMASPMAWVTINIAAVNDAPVLANIGNRTLVLGNTLTFTATATDPDAGQTKTFSLITPPTGAVINAATGAFSWKPAATGTYVFKVRVTDNGSPILYDEEQITVTVTATLAPITLNATSTTHPGAALSGEPTIQKAATLYPNPVVDRFKLVLSKPAQQVQLTIIDSKGAIISTHSYQLNGQQQLDVDATQLKQGSYLVRVQTPTSTETLKFVK